MKDKLESSQGQLLVTVLGCLLQELLGGCRELRASKVTPNCLWCANPSRERTSKSHKSSLHALVFTSTFTLQLTLPFWDANPWLSLGSQPEGAAPT